MREARIAPPQPLVPNGPEWREWLVTANDDQVRLDTFLAHHLPSVSRRAIFSLITAGHVSINQRPCKKSKLVHTGDRIRAWVQLCLSPNPSLVIPVVYEHGAVLGLDKPPGVASVALRFTDAHTVANFLVAHYPETVLVSLSPRAALEAGVIHRLDTPTSGLLLAARTASAYTALRAQFSSGQITKHYLAWVHGRLTVQQLDGIRHFFLVPAGKRGQHMRVVPAEHYHDYRGKAQEAISTYTCLETHSHYSLIRIQLHTGVRHQIRAHLAALGHPLVGDTQYGAPAGSSRLALHAEAVRFVHPETAESVQLTSPASNNFLPEEI